MEQRSIVSAHIDGTASSFDLPATRRALEQGLDEGHHLGAQLHVHLRDQGSCDLTLGERRPGQAMDVDTLMVWLSSTKPVAAVALAQLWERGLLDLDDPIARHIPEFASQGKENITLRHALTHTAGLRLLSFGWPEASWEEIIATLCAARPEPRWPPGRKAGYHMASSWFVLGEVVHRIDGRPFSQFVRQEIFEPLSMTDCWIGMPRERFLAYGDRIGLMFSTEHGQAQARGWDRETHVVGCSPGGNGHGPMQQLARFYRMLLGKGELEGRRLLSPHTVEALVVPHRVGMFDHTFRHRLDWGLGFIVNSEHYGESTVPYGYGPHASRRTFGHSGFQSSTAFADPEHGLVVALVVNGQPGEPQHTQRFRRVTSAIYEDLDLVPEPLPAPRRPKEARP